MTVTEPGRVHLVTGGSGYFGSALVRALRAEGLSIRVLDLIDTPDRPADIEFVRGDIRDPRAVREACDGASVVYHNVALVPLAKDRRAIWSVNYHGTANLLRCCRDEGVAKVVHLSTSAVFGVPQKLPVDDQTVPRPQEEYGRAKYVAEGLCRQYVEQGMDVTIVRPRTIVGPGRLGIMQILFEWLYQGRNLPVLGGGDNLYQFVHADDLAKAVIRAGQRPGSSIYNIGADGFGTIRQLLLGLIEHSGGKSRIVSLPADPVIAAMKLTSWLRLSPLADLHALLYGRAFFFDSSRAKQELEWAPRYDNREMFEQAYDWYVANRNAILSGQRRNASQHRSPVRQGILSALSWLLQVAG